MNIRNLFLLVYDYISDIIRYARYSSAIKQPHTIDQLEAKITARYHNIEKGLSLKQVRPGFGFAKIKRLFRWMDEYVSTGFDTKQQTFQIALAVMDSYLKHPINLEIDTNWITEKMNNYESLGSESGLGGIIEFSKFDLTKHAQGNFEEQMTNRYSCRNFSSEMVDITTIKRAIEISRKAPSVCNRQSGRVHVFQGDICEKILNIQKGNGGFGNNVKTVLIVTSLIESFTIPTERNQSYINGAIWGTTILYSLNSLGLATCTLNWSAGRKKDIALKKLTDIQDNENIIFLIAVGNYPDILNFAKSVRKPIDAVMKVH